MERSCWTRWWKGLAAPLLAAVTTLGTPACSQTCEDTLTCQFEVDLPFCPGDPAEMLGDGVPAECGLWVSSSQGDDDNDGSPGAPLATLGEAAARAVTGRRRVYACAESFEESLIWPSGVSLHGGFHCANLNWLYSNGSSRTQITAPPDEIPLTVDGSTIPDLALFTDLNLLAADATKPGGSSIAMLALAGARAEMRRGRLKSGNGAAGADGDDGDHIGTAAKAGVHGKDGAPACTGDVGMGGQLVALTCEDGTSFGGQGGHGGVLAANSGDDGELMPTPNPQGFGLGGKGEDLVAGLFCTPGIGGAVGKDGDPGLGGGWPPRLAPAGYLGVWGQDGKPGRAGQGGGGGGASAGNAACGGLLHGGAGGGSGGTGGCGGKGGRGGQPGGASIGVAMLADSLVLVDIIIVSGNGGNGGRGGTPQQGGQGGLPGIGGAGSPAAGGPNPGCVGGGGGYGGDGGHAGGGLGGPSLAVAYAGTQPPEIRGTQELSYGQGGSGGPGSDPTVNGTGGEDGKSGLFEVLLP